MKSIIYFLPIITMYVGQFIECVRHWFLIKKRNVSPNKPLSLLLRVALGVACIVLEYFHGDPFRPMWVSIGAFFFLSWWMHNYLTNIMRRTKHVWQLNKTGTFDVFMAGLFDARVWFTMISLLTFIFVGMYLVNDWEFLSNLQ